MGTQFDFNDLFEGVEESLANKTEAAVLEFTEELVTRMACQGVTRAALARKIGCSPAYVTKILRGSTNFTLETMVKIADVLGCKLRTHMQPDGKGRSIGVRQRPGPSLQRRSQTDRNVDQPRPLLRAREFADRDLHRRSGLDVPTKGTSQISIAPEVNGAAMLVKTKGKHARKSVSLQ